MRRRGHETSHFMCPVISLPPHGLWHTVLHTSKCADSIQRHAKLHIWRESIKGNMGKHQSPHHIINQFTGWKTSLQPHLAANHCHPITCILALDYNGLRFAVHGLLQNDSQLTMLMQWMKRNSSDYTQSSAKHLVNLLLNAGCIYRIWVARLERVEVKMVSNNHDRDLVENNSQSTIKRPPTNRICDFQISDVSCQWQPKKG